MKFFRRLRGILPRFAAYTLILALAVTLCPAKVSATEPAPTPPAAYSEPIQTDSIPGWPAGPAIYAESGILVDLDTGKVLYAKNIDKTLYPASITKIMTTLISLERCAPDEQVVFSQTALDSIEWDSSNMGCLLDECLTMEQCWYGMMLQSANEVCSGVAEHIAGSISAFVDLMNERAQELGCTGTHFANPNGLPDENHYTTAHDMALIAMAAFENETFRTITGSEGYQIPPTNKYTDTRYLYNHHKMVLSDSEYHYDGCIGGKTGYTQAALNTLVTYAARDGRTLLCVTMRTSGRQVYTDTASLFDYGFSGSFPDEGASFLSIAPTETPTPEPTQETEAPDAQTVSASSEAPQVLVPDDIPEEEPEKNGLAAFLESHRLLVWLVALLVLAALILLAVQIRITVVRNRKRRRKRRRRRR